MKPNYILLKDLPIFSNPNGLNFSSNGNNFSQMKLLHHNSKTFSLPTKSNGYLIFLHNIIQNIITQLRYFAQFKCYHKKLKS